MGGRGESPDACGRSWRASDGRLYLWGFWEPWMPDDNGWGLLVTAFSSDLPIAGYEPIAEGAHDWNAQGQVLIGHEATELEAVFSTGGGTIVACGQYMLVPDGYCSDMVSATGCALSYYRSYL